MGKERVLPGGAGAGGLVVVSMPVSTVCRLHDGVPIMWSVDQCEEMSSIVVGDLGKEQLRLDFFSLEALDRFVTAAKQARHRLRLRITTYEDAMAAEYAAFRVRGATGRTEAAGGAP